VNINRDKKRKWNCWGKKKELQKGKHEGMLNIQLLVIKLSPHSSSSSKCAQGKVYNEKI